MVGKSKRHSCDCAPIGGTRSRRASKGTLLLVTDIDWADDVHELALHDWIDLQQWETLEDIERVVGRDVPSKDYLLAVHTAKRIKHALAEEGDRALRAISTLSPASADRSQSVAYSFEAISVKNIPEGSIVPGLAARLTCTECQNEMFLPMGVPAGTCRCGCQKWAVHGLPEPKKTPMRDGLPLLDPMPLLTAGIGHSIDPGFSEPGEFRMAAYPPSFARRDRGIRAPSLGEHVMQLRTELQEEREKRDDAVAIAKRLERQLEGALVVDLPEKLETYKDVGDAAQRVELALRKWGAERTPTGVLPPPYRVFVPVVGCHELIAADDVAAMKERMDHAERERMRMGDRLQVTEENVRRFSDECDRLRGKLQRLEPEPEQKAK